VEVSALKPTALAAPRGSATLLRLQSDERLIELTRRGQQAAFEALFSRYHARLLSFCRHMLGSREDAEDVLQEVFAAAFNAILADEREINVRPWLYRIARNRSLNHLRRASAVGVDSMDIHFADHGQSTGEKVLRRESFRQLIADVQQLPETQRTALLLREIDALSYEQIAQTMETTVPSVKSLLVRARISLAEAAEARLLSCEEVRQQLGEAAEGLLKLEAPARRHLRDCERCRSFRKHLKANNTALAALLPVGPVVLLKKLILTKFGSASAGGAHVAGAGGATAGAAGVSAAGAGAGAGAAGGLSVSGLATAGAGAIATKAAATLAAAALVTAGAVAVGHGGATHTHRHHAPVVASTYAASAAGAAAYGQAVPAVVRSTPQPSTALTRGVAGAAAIGHAHRHLLKHPPAAVHPAATPESADLTATAHAPTTPAPLTATQPARPVAPAPPVTEVTSESTQLPTTSTSSTQTSSSATPTATTETPQPASPPPPTSTTESSSSSTPPPASAPEGEAASGTGGTPSPPAASGAQVSSTATASGE
jgi:RNA polymerase sigma factor (sigma-70 family)